MRPVFSAPAEVQRSFVGSRLLCERLRCLGMTRLLGLAEGGGWDGAHGPPDAATQRFSDAELLPWGKFGAHIWGRRNVLRGVWGVKGGLERWFPCGGWDRIYDSYCGAGSVWVRTRPSLWDSNPFSNVSQRCRAGLSWFAPLGLESDGFHSTILPCKLVLMHTLGALRHPKSGPCGPESHLRLAARLKPCPSLSRVGDYWVG
jgi:hypothetical protein